MAEVGCEVCVLARTDQSVIFFQEAERESGEGPGEVNISAKPKNKTETTCPPSGDR